MWGFGAFAFRLAFQWTIANIKGHRFEAFDRPQPPPPSFYTGGMEEVEEVGSDREPVAIQGITHIKGKFF